jgi:hypothetical protein
MTGSLGFCAAWPGPEGQRIGLFLNKMVSFERARQNSLLCEYSGRSTLDCTEYTLRCDTAHRTADQKTARANYGRVRAISTERSKDSFCSHRQRPHMTIQETKVKKQISRLHSSDRVVVILLLYILLRILRTYTLIRNEIVDAASRNQGIQTVIRSFGPHVSRPSDSKQRG